MSDVLPATDSTVAAPRAVTPSPSAFTVTNTWTTAGEAPVRRGRGTFSHRLRTEEMEQRAAQMRLREMNEGSSVMTTATTTVVLPHSTLGKMHTAEEEDTAQFALLKKSIPLTQPSVNPVQREYFGGAFDAEREAADTVRQLLFRGEKRRRYCVIIGDLQCPDRVVTLKLFGHRGNKPFKLQDKLIRLINLSIGKPRPRKTLPEDEADENANNDATETEVVNREVPRGPVEDGTADSDYEVENAIVRDVLAEDLRKNADTPEPPPETAEAVAAQRVAHEAAGFPAELEEDSTEVSRSVPTTTEAASQPSVAAATTVAPPAAVDAAPAKDKSTPSNSAVGWSSMTAPSPAAAAAAHRRAVISGPEKPDDHDDVDHYFERGDEVVPLTVQRDEDTMNTHEVGLANSPVLTSKYFSSLTTYFMREFRYLLSMEDARSQNVSVNVNLGAAYCCLARHGSYSTPLRHATFGQFVQRMNDESMQLYFIKDCPTCVSRAVDRECGSLYHDSSVTLVKINFFSNERQSHSVARAVWDSTANAFRLLDMENMGVSFNWSIFSLDETYACKSEVEQRPSIIPSQPPAAIGKNGGEESVSAFHHPPRPVDEESAAAESNSIRNKTVAYPFEVEFRAFRRWKQHSDHPAAALAEAILERISIAESNLINHGSSIGYERMDLSKVCEADYAAEDFNVESIVVEHTARMKPTGTDITVDTTTSLFIENFAAARTLKERVAQYGAASVAAMQNPSNNNYMRGQSNGRGGRCRGGAGMAMPPVNMEEVLQPTSKLTFFRSRGTTIHWRFKPGCSVEENLAPMAEALKFVQQVLHTANDIERNSARGGAAPDALE